MSITKEEIVKLCAIYNENKSNSSEKNLLDGLLKVPRVKELVLYWKDNITEQALLDYMDILLDVAMESFDPDRTHYTTFKVHKNGVFFRMTEDSPKGKAIKNLNNLRFLDISPFDRNININSFYEQNFPRRDLILKYLEEMPPKGLYFYGNLGIGKSFLLQFITLEYARKGWTSAFVNTIDLQSFLMQDIKEVNRIIKELKEIDFLAIDDLGAESDSEWFRYSVLLPIIQYRNSAKKNTCFSSNYNFLTLSKKMTKDKNGQDLHHHNACRLVDRIKEMSQAYFLKGKNFRDLK